MIFFNIEDKNDKISFTEAIYKFHVCMIYTSHPPHCQLTTHHSSSRDDDSHCGDPGIR